MTRANAEQQKHTPWFAKAGAACSIVPIARFVGPNTFALKGGGYGCLFSLTGVDDEGKTNQELEALVRSVEGALRGLPEGSCLYQYTRVMSGASLPQQASYSNAVTEQFVSDRATHLTQNARFRRVDLHWCLTLEPPKIKAMSRKPEENTATNTRMLADVQKTATLLEGHLASAVGLRLLDKQAAFQFFSYLFNLQDWAEQDRLRSDEGVDRQIVKNPVAWHSDHLEVGTRHVQMFSLQATPEASRPGLFSDLLTLDCDSVLCTTWRVKSTASARREIDQQEKFISFFKVGVFTRVMSGRDTTSLDTGAGAKAANNAVDDLSEVIRSLDKKAQGEFSLRLLLAADSQAQLRDAVPTVHRIFVGARAQAVEETLGNLSAFYAMFPENQKFSVFPLWLSEEHHARLSSVFAPHLGHPHSEDLDAEYLNVLETRTRTPFFQDAYVDGVRVMLILGPTGTGKSVHGNTLVALEQKYGGFTYVFDIGGSYESVVELYGGKVDRIGKDGPRVNPFALEPTENNIKFLYSFVKLLLTKGGAELEPEDDDVIYKAVQDMYLLDPENRRLSNLFLPKKLDRYMSKWVGKGVYNAIFDNLDDSLSLSRVQCFDFAGVNNEQYADLIEPLMVWLLRRLNDVLYDPANLGVPKHILIEEIFSSMKNRQLLEGALASIRTVRKNLGGVTMIGQSAEDLGENADSIVNSCTSFLFLKDATFNRKRYAELFKMNEQQIALFESLQDREALYMRRDGITKVVTLNLDPRSYATFSTKPKDRVRRSKLIAKYGLAEGIARFAQGETAYERTRTVKPPIPIYIAIGLACGSATLRALPPAHPLEPSTPRTVTVSESATPPVVRAGLLQSTLIVLPAEEKVANVFAGDTVDWVFDGGHVASRFISVKPKLAGSSTDIHIVSDHGNEYTLQLREVSAEEDTHYDSKVLLSAGDKAMQQRLTDLPVFVPAADLDRAKAEAAEAKAAQATETKSEATEAEQYQSQYPGSLRFDYAWDEKKGKELGLEQIWHDDKFTYLRGHFQETPALYEVKDKKLSLINFDFANGLYTVPKQLDNGYLTIGKQKVEFHRTTGSH